MSLYESKGSLRLPWGPHPRALQGKSERVILAKGSSVMVLVRDCSCTLKAEASNRSRHSFPLHSLPFLALSRLQVSSSQEWCRQTLLARAHARLKQLPKSTSAAAQAKPPAPKIHSIALIIVQLGTGLQRGKVIKTWGWLVVK